MQNRIIYGALIFPTKDMICSKIDWLQNVNIQIDPITQTMSHQLISKNISGHRILRGASSEKRRYPGIIENLTRIPYFDPWRNTHNFVIMKEDDAMTGIQHRLETQALNIG